MPIKLSPIVMGIPSRAEAAKRVAAEAQCGVNWDPQMRGPWANARECWLSTPEDATHRLLLNDDAILCPGFLEAANAAIAAHPDEIISFFTTRKDLADARDKGASWLTYSRSICGVALVLPKALIKPFVDWSDTFTRPAWYSADARLFLWAHVVGRTVWYTVPSLVQHDEGHTSTIRGTANTGRVSPVYADEGAAGVDWTGAVLDRRKGPPPGYLRAKRQWFRPEVAFDGRGLPYLHPAGAGARKLPDVEIAPIVMTCPSRLDRGMALAEALGCPFNADYESRGPWWNARECWLSTPMGATHRLVIQDDAILCPDFLATVKRAVQQRPEAIICLYSDRPHVLEAKADGCPFVAYDDLAWGLAIVMPMVWAKEMVAWRDRWILPEKKYDDLSVLLWALFTGKRIYVPVPNLVQHDPAMESAFSPGVMNSVSQSRLWASEGTSEDFHGSTWYVPGARHNFVHSRAQHFVNYKLGQPFAPWIASMGGITPSSEHPDK